jgi:creatinine deaminase
MKWSPELFEEAYRQAAAGLAEGGVPIGSSLGRDQTLLASGRNERVQKGDPIAHGEMCCLRNAGRLPSYRDLVIYTTLAPCSMCAGAIILFKIPLVVIGEAKTFPGEIDLLHAHGVETVVLDDERCVQLMKEFQSRYPKVWAEDIGEIE